MVLCDCVDVLCEFDICNGDWSVLCVYLGSLL